MTTTTPAEQVQDQLARISKFSEGPAMHALDALTSLAYAGAYGVNGDGSIQAAEWHDAMADLLGIAQDLRDAALDAWADFPMETSASQKLFKALEAFDDAIAITLAPANG